MKPRRLQSATISSSVTGPRVDAGVFACSAHGVRHTGPRCRSTSTAARTATVRGDPDDDRRPGHRLRGVRRAGRARLPPRRRPLQGLGLLHDRLRQQGQGAADSRQRRLAARSDSGDSDERREDDAKSDSKESKKGRRLEASPSRSRTRSPPAQVLGLAALRRVAVEELLDLRRTPPRRRSGCRRARGRRSARAPGVLAPLPPKIAANASWGMVKRAHVADERLRRVPADPAGP